MKISFLPLFSVLAFFPMISHAEEAAPAKPETLIQELYQSQEDVFSPHVNKELSEKFLASTLIKLLILDVKRAGDEPGAIDFDILTFSQDLPEIKKFATQSEVKGETAVVKTTFENYGERMVINFQCVKEAGQWRISDVTYEDGTSIVKLLSGTE